MSNIAVIGSGSFGCALANILSKRNNVKIWSYLKDEAETINIEHKCMFIKDLVLNPNIIASTNYQEVIKNTEYIVIVTPSRVVRETCKNIKDYVTDQEIVLLSKGMEEEKLLSEVIYEELGVNPKIARRAGLLHDIGKALDHDMEGTHVELGVEVLKKFKENSIVINEVEAHHGDVEPQTLEAVLVQAADAISASRPGARRETLEAYIKRLESLEAIADSFEGVEKSFAIQAGREVRIIVKPDKITDDQMTVLARDVAQRVENEMDYPGQIKVNIIRETRVVDYAK